MESLNANDFDSKLEVLRSLIRLRKEPNKDLEQNYVTENTILLRLKAMGDLISGQRVLAIGDGDLTALSIAIFGNPTEVVVTDIDKRLTDLLFEANIEYELPVRFVYHDMRLRMIEILMNQFTVLIMEPPQSRAGITVFMSRAMQCIQEGYEDQIFVSIPSSGDIREHFNNHCEEYNIKIIESHPFLNQYQNVNVSNTDFLRLEFSKNKVLPTKSHWIKPFFAGEEEAEIKEYRCLCGEIIEVGEDKEYLSIDELKTRGHACCHKDVFAFHSKIKLL